MKNHRKPIDHRKKAAAFGGYSNSSPAQINENPASFFGNFPSTQTQSKPTQPIPKPSYQTYQATEQVKAPPPKKPESNLIDLLDQPEEIIQQIPTYFNFLKIILIKQNIFNSKIKFYFFLRKLCLQRLFLLKTKKNVFFVFM